MDRLGITASDFNLSTVYMGEGCGISPLPSMDDIGEGSGISPLPLMVGVEEGSGISPLPPMEDSDGEDFDMFEENFMAASGSSFYVESHPTFSNPPSVTCPPTDTISIARGTSSGALSKKPYRPTRRGTSSGALFKKPDSRIRNCPVKPDDPLLLSIFKEKKLIEHPIDRSIRAKYLFEKEGKSTSKIAKEMGIQKPHVKKLINFNKHEKHDEVIGLLEEGCKLKTISEKLGITKRAVERIINLSKRLKLWNNFQSGKPPINDVIAKKSVVRDLNILEDYYINGEVDINLLKLKYTIGRGQLSATLLSFNKFEDHDQIIQEYINGKKDSDIRVINGRPVCASAVQRVIHHQIVIEAWLIKHDRKLPNMLPKGDAVEGENFEEDEIAAPSASTVDSSMNVNTLKRRRTDFCGR